MTARSLPREMGTWIYCNGTNDKKGCPTKEKRFTANIVFEHNRSFAAKEGWGRGLRTNHKRRDLCPSCLAEERELFTKQKADWEAEKARRAELRKLKLSGAPLPKKPRKRKAASSATPTASPSAASAPAPAT